ncbi:MAG: threonine-phosphate decarboxylase [Bryobacteraceae bacterium]
MHGGDVWQVAEELGIQASELLDFSANINPRGLPPRAKERLARDASDPQLLSFYPDLSARRLRHALSEHLSIDPDAIVVGPGAEALLAPILRCLQPKRALIPIPAFSEYRRVAGQQQIEVTPFFLEREELFRTPVDRFCQEFGAQQHDVIFLNNPHNPSGAMLDAEEVRRVRAAANSSGAMLLLDEAFIDYTPHASLVRDAAAAPGLIVLRSLTKFYGCPALRVGYAVADPATIRRIQSLLPTWPVTQLAIDALAEAVADHEYAEASLRENAVRRQALASSLGALGVFVFPSAANYLLLELPAPVPELRAHLIANHRILIRNCDSYEGLAPARYVRVAVRTAADNHRLIRAFVS